MTDHTETDQHETDQIDTDQHETDRTETDRTETETEQAGTDEHGADEPHTDVPGVSTDPEDKNKSIAVDTNERLDQKDKHRDDVPDDQLEKERQERLDPEKRPENTEVDNSQREFDPKTGLFDDTELDPPEDAPYSTTEAEESNTDKQSSTDKEPKDREESRDAEESKEAKESKDTES